jgi:hypothetical protein
METPHGKHNEKSVEKNHSTDAPEERGKKAIEAAKQFQEPKKSPQLKEDEEKKDAEQWRNEG